MICTGRKKIAVASFKDERSEPFDGKARACDNAFDGKADRQGRRRRDDQSRRVAAEPRIFKTDALGNAEVAVSKPCPIGGLMNCREESHRYSGFSQILG